MTRVFKQITKDNWELISAFAGVDEFYMRSKIGKWVGWENIERQREHITIEERPTRIYTTVTDGYIADETKYSNVSDQMRRIIVMKRNGYPNDDIAEALGISEERIQRSLEEISFTG